MRYSDSILGNLLKPISRRWFDGLVDRHAGNAYDKRFGSWDHLVALVYAVPSLWVERCADILEGKEEHRAEHGTPITAAHLGTRMGIALPVATTALAQL